MSKKSLYKQFIAFIKKEFYHVIRDKKTILIMFGLPIVQILLFGFALTNEVKNVNILIINPSNSVEAAAIINKIRSSSYFTIYKIENSTANIENYFKKGKIKCAVVFLNNFSYNKLNNNQIQTITDATDPNIAKTIINYIDAIVGEHIMQNSNVNTPLIRVIPEAVMLYNPEMNSSWNFIPGVIALIMMIVCTTLTSISIVREKELGSMEILLVSPFKPSLVLLAKAIPFLVLSIINLILILTMSRFVLQMPINGSLILLLVESIIFIITCLAFGLVISNIADTQASAMLISMMGMMLPTLLFTGFLFPLENMPTVFQWIANIVPARWYFLIAKNIMLKNVSFMFLWKETLILVSMAIILLFTSVKQFKIRLQ